MVLYSGHGEFPRVIFAPGSLAQAFALGQKAFEMADKYQVPAFILSDQYLMDSYYNCPAFTFKPNEIKQEIVRTDKDYRRYKLTSSGISPRGIPDYGDGLVLVDSDEHDEWGRITEKMDIRNAMVNKRLKKLVQLKKEALPPTLVGSKNFKTLIVCWGSNYLIVKEALDWLKKKDLAMLHFSQVYPVADVARKYFKQALRVIIVENNATGQFAQLLKLQLGVEADEKILKYDGLPFFVDELAPRIEKAVKKGGRR